MYTNFVLFLINGGEGFTISGVCIRIAIYQKQIIPPFSQNTKSGLPNILTSTNSSFDQIDYTLKSSLDSTFCGLVGNIRGGLYV
jgi:hypothetical protein